MDKDRHTLLIREKGSLELQMELKGSICPPDRISLLEHSEAQEASPSHGS